MYDPRSGYGQAECLTFSGDAYTRTQNTGQHTYSQTMLYSFRNAAYIILFEHSSSACEHSASCFNQPQFTLLMVFSKGQELIVCVCVKAALQSSSQPKTLLMISKPQSHQKCLLARPLPPDHKPSLTLRGTFSIDRKQFGQVDMGHCG